jgi:uncharacterized protein (TIGR02391 family)
MSDDPITDELEALAAEALDLRDERRDSPKVGLWKTRTREFVEREFGEARLKVFNKALFFKRVVSSDAQGQAMHVDSMKKAVEFLDTLRSDRERSAPVAKPRDDETGLLRMSDLHPRIVKGCARHFEQGDYGIAVEQGFKIVRARLRQLTGHETGSEAFGKTDLRVEGAAAEWVDEDFNEATKFLTMAIDRFRNEKAHTVDGNIEEPVRAFEYLAVSSLAMRILDRAVVEPS